MTLISRTVKILVGAEPAFSSSSGNRFVWSKLPNGSGQRNAVLSDALTEAVAWAEQTRKPIIAEDLDFTAKKKVMAQLSPRGARMLSGPLYAKYRQVARSEMLPGRRRTDPD